MPHYKTNASEYIFSVKLFFCGRFVCAHNTQYWTTQYAIALIYFVLIVIRKTKCVFLSRSECWLCLYNAYNCHLSCKPDYAIMPPVGDYIMVTNKPFIYRLLFSALRCSIYTHSSQMYTKHRNTFGQSLKI